LPVCDFHLPNLPLLLLLLLKALLHRPCCVAKRFLKHGGQRRLLLLQWQLLRVYLQVILLAIAAIVLADKEGARQSNRNNSACQAESFFVVWLLLKLHTLYLQHTAKVNA
jgi:hypothetical protein